MFISGYPKTFTEQDLKDLIGPEMITHINFTTKLAEVTFKSAKLAQKSFIIDGV